MLNTPYIVGGQEVCQLAWWLLLLWNGAFTLIALVFIKIKTERRSCLEKAKQTELKSLLRDHLERVE